MVRLPGHLDITEIQRLVGQYVLTVEWQGLRIAELEKLIPQPLEVISGAAETGKEAQNGSKAEGVGKRTQ